MPQIWPDSGAGQEEQGIPTSHDVLLTPIEHKAAQLLVTLAWRLDGGQLISADQMLARLCRIPTNYVAMASIVLLRNSGTASYRCSSRQRSRSSTTSAPGSPTEQGVRLAPPNPRSRLPRNSANVLPS